MTWAPGLTLEQIEKDAILTAFSFYNKNIYITAKSLNIDVDDLRKKFVKFENERLKEERKLEDRKRIEEEYRARARGVSPSLPISNIRKYNEIENTDITYNNIDKSFDNVGFVEKKLSTKKSDHKIDAR